MRLFIIRSPFDSVGDKTIIEKYILNIYKKGVNIYFLTATNQHLSIHKSNIKIKKLILLKLPFNIIFLKIIRYIFTIIYLTIETFKAFKKYKFDLLISFGDHFYSGMPIYISNRIFRYPYLIRLGGFAGNKFTKDLVKKILFSADKILIVNKYFKRSLINLGIKEKKIIYSPNKVDITIFNPNNKNENFIRNLGINPNGQYILFVGRIEKQKGIYYLIKALPNIIKEFPNLKLIILGQFKNFRYFKKLVLNLKLNDKIIHLNPISHSNMPYLLNSVKLLVFPTLSEGMPNILLEALACGLPVVSSNISVISYNFKNGVHCILINPKNPEDISNKVIYLLKNKKESKKLSENGLKLILKEFSSTKGHWGDYFIKNNLDLIVNEIKKDKWKD